MPIVVAVVLAPAVPLRYAPTRLGPTLSVGTSHPIADIPAAALCGGWAWVPGEEGEGLVGATVRVSVAGRGSCDGVAASRL